MIQSHVKDIMERKGVTIKRMVEDTRLAEMTLIRARREQIGQCRLDTLILIAQYLDCTVNELFSVSYSDKMPHQKLSSRSDHMTDS
ncbi:MAG: helix-turn-helix transcriptional regulator [Deltaproteobacteria bacterium]|jgi:DNA-binding Xre family transcriptional regulator|nr:helix-turn-helix transcriptional regulator [Deltaproteobacteria bacterium]